MCCKIAEWLKQQVKLYANSTNDSSLDEFETKIHVTRSIKRGALVSQILFKQSPILPNSYIEVLETQFKSDFFESLRRMIKTNQTGLSYLQQIMNLSIHDAKALYEELQHWWWFYSIPTLICDLENVSNHYSSVASTS